MDNQEVDRSKQNDSRQPEDVHKSFSTSMEEGEGGSENRSVARLMMGWQRAIILNDTFLNILKFYWR